MHSEDPVRTQRTPVCTQTTLHVPRGPCILYSERDNVCTQRGSCVCPEALYVLRENPACTLRGDPVCTHGTLCVLGGPCMQSEDIWGLGYLGPRSYGPVLARATWTRLGPGPYGHMGLGHMDPRGPRSYYGLIWTHVDHMGPFGTRGVGQGPG
jgi:hypothetical protein